MFLGKHSGAAQRQEPAQPVSQAALERAFAAQMASSGAMASAVSATVGSVLNQQKGEIATLVRTTVRELVTESDYLRGSVDSAVGTYVKQDLASGTKITSLLAEEIKPKVETLVKRLHQTALDDALSACTQEAGAEIRRSVRELAAGEFDKVARAAIAAQTEALWSDPSIKEKLTLELSRVLPKALRDPNDALGKTMLETLKTEMGQYIETEYKPFRIETKPTGGISRLVRRHRDYDKVRRAALAGNVMMVGPAGTGKSKIAANLADELGMQFYSNSKVAHEHKLLGFQNATGEYVGTQFFQAYTTGGLFLFDEVDGSSPAALVALNDAISSGQCDFPGFKTPVRMHEDFLCIATANTFGRGHDRLYVGRAQLDAATIDRFICVEIDYDEQLEIEVTQSDEWVKRVQKLRRAAAELQKRLIISTRACVFGAALLKQGFSVAETEEMVIWRGLDRDSIREIRAKAGLKEAA